MYKGILQTFVNLGNALTLFPFAVTNLIEDYENLRLLWDEVQVVCEGSTAVQVRLFALRYDDDCESSDEKKLPPPPEPLPLVPPTSGIGSISPPYLNNDNVTNPNILDKDFKEPFDPIGNECQPVLVEYEYFFVPNNRWLSSSGLVYGPVTSEVEVFDGQPWTSNLCNVPILNARSHVRVKCRGRAVSGCVCTDEEFAQLEGGNSPGSITGVRNVVFTPQ